jgi:chromosome partitioning protein
LAQGLSLRGHRVLAIDTDPQGSLTTLHGILPETEVDAEMTIGAAVRRQRDRHHAMPSGPRTGTASTWLRLRRSCSGAEFALPARQMREAGSRFWDVLNEGLEPVRDLYDVIVIDTPPRFPT